jgi:hypothetical protein
MLKTYHVPVFLPTNVSFCFKICQLYNYKKLDRPDSGKQYSNLLRPGYSLGRKLRSLQCLL